MKRLTLFFITAIACSCNNGGTASHDAMDEPSETTATTSTAAYPYTIEHPDNWEIGNSANTMIALKSLKAWEEGKMDESAAYFADSVHMQFDGLDKKMSNDSIKAMFASSWNNFKSVEVKMMDWESVVSKDKSEEWVTLWYKQQWETKNGIKDSIAIINDLQIKDGKIIRLSEYSRKLH